MSGPVTDAVLWVPEPDVLALRVGGMAVLERQLFLLAEAGVRRAWVAAPRTAEAQRLRLPPTLEVQWLGKDADPPVDARLPYAALNAGWLLRSSALKAVLADPPARHTRWRPAERDESALQIVPSRGERVLRVETVALPSGACAPIRRGADAAAALEWLLDGVRKAGDGFMARHFDRRISMAVSRRLLDTTVTPNQMTVFSTCLGLCGAALMALPGYRERLAGALLVWLHTVLDGCDGELARLRFQSSPFGGTLDFWGDNLVHVALFSGIAAGLWRESGDAIHLWAGASACVATAVSASLAFLQSIRRRSTNAVDRSPLFSGLHVPEPAGAARTLAKVEDMLAQRDFIYLLVLAAVFERQDWFLWAAGLGAPLFCIALLYLLRRPAPAPAAAAAAARGSLAANATLGGS